MARKAATFQAKLNIRLWFLKAPQPACEVYNVNKFIVVCNFVFWSRYCSIQGKYYINAVQLLYNALDVQLWLTSTVGYVPAEEHFSLLPVQKTGTFQQQGRGEHVPRYCWQDVDGSAHFSPVCWKTNEETSTLLWFLSEEINVHLKDEFRNSDVQAVTENSPIDSSLKINV